MVIEDEYVTRLRTMVDGLPDVDLDRLGRCDGPRMLVQLDGGGLPVSGVVYLPDANRLVDLRCPLPREAT